MPALHELIVRMTGPPTQVGSVPSGAPLAPHEALVLWLMALPDDADYAAAAVAALDRLPEPSTGQDLLRQFRLLLADVAAQGDPAAVARHGMAVRRRRPVRADA